ncbi:MAG: hypothetical protein L6290_12550 [Thermodesulfovibrionales bacterium]|jgi:hypothetical protein|nr:hypothetical protein [Thermodesulfovibrionales bacterium]
MTEITEKLGVIAERISEHIVAVKGTLELVDASVDEEELHSLVLKAVDRMDTLQTLSNEMLSHMAQILEKIRETKPE